MILESQQQLACEFGQLILKAPSTLIDKHKIHEDLHLPKPRLSQTVLVVDISSVTLLKKISFPCNLIFKMECSYILFLGSSEPSASAFLIAEFTGMCHPALLYALF